MIVSLSGWLATALTVAFAAESAGPSQQAPDLVLLGGKVFTSDTTRPWAEAVAIRGERIVAVGTTPDIRRLASASTRVIDVGGRVVVPGFNDAHDHVLAGSPGTNVSMGGPEIDAAGDQVLDSVRAVTGRVARGTWIRVEIWAKAFADTTLRRQTLDREAPDHPVAIYTGWGHGMIVNAAGMRALGIRDTEPDPIGGWRPLRVRFEHGGVLGTPDLWARAAAKGMIIVGNLPFIPDARTLPKAFLDSLAGDFRPEIVSRFPLGLGSDAVARSPFAGLANALRFPYDPRPSREYLVHAYTWGSAYAELAETQKGSLAPGMLADIAVLSQDIFTVPVEALPRTESVLTLVGGRAAWDAGVVR